MVLASYRVEGGLVGLFIPMPDSQKANRDWWEQHPMRYDWHGSFQLLPGSKEWFEENDKRFLEATYFARGEDGTAFGRFLRPALVRGRVVLEVGCGIGTHAAMLARAGARLTAIDITEYAVEVTRRRFALYGLAGQIQQADAEHLPFRDATFDMVWSWGVIHHSSSTERCIQEITRVLRDGGRLLFMVYHRPSIVYYLHCGFIRGILLGQLLRGRLEDIYVAASDGYYARTFTAAELNALLVQGFEQISIKVVGQKAELFPIPGGRVKEILERHTPDWLASTFLSRWGGMIVVEAVKKPARLSGSIG